MGGLWILASSLRGLPKGGFSGRFTMAPILPKREVGFNTHGGDPPEGYERALKNSPGWEL